MEWTNKTIGDIAFVTKLAGFEHTKYIQGNCIHERKDDSFIPLFIGKTVRDGRIDKNFDWYIPKSIANQLPRSFLKRKCLVLPYVGTIGDLAVFDASYDALLGSNIAKIELNPNCGYSEEFIYYYLKSPRGQTVLLKDEQGGIQKNITMEAIRNVLLPDVDEDNQKKIVSVLSALDDKIALNKKMNQKLEVMAKRLYDYWFVQFDFPDKNGRPYKTTGGPMTYNPTLKREIPTGWEVARLGDLFKTNRGVSYSTPTLGAEGDGVPMINLASFSPNESYNEKGIKYYKGEYTDEKVLKPFDFVMCNTQQTAIDPQKDIIGRSMLVPDIFDGDIVSSHHVNTIKLEKENLKFYLNRLFNTKFYHAYISKFANGTNILGLIFSGVEDYMCEIPSDGLLEKFAKISLDIEKKKSKIIKENQKLTALRDKLLPLLMNGQVVVG